MAESATETGAPIVFRDGTVLTMDDAHTVLPGRRRARRRTTGSPRSGTALDVPEGTRGDRRHRRHRDAGDDRHPPAHVADRDARLRRRLDADPVLRLVLPRARQDVPPRGHPRRQPALRLGRARGRRDHHRRLVPRAADRRPRRGRGRRAARRCRAGSCWPTATSRPARGSGRPTPTCRRSSKRRAKASDLLGVQLAFDVTGDPAFPEKAAFEVARELGLPVTTHAGVWGATNDDGIRLMHENGFVTPETVYVHAATLSPDSYHRIAASGGSVSVSTESEQSAGQGYPPTWQLRKSRHPGVDVDGHQRVVEQRPVLGDAVRRSAPTARASTWRRTPRATPSPTTGCAPSRSSTGRPAAAPRCSAATTSAVSSRARRPTSCCIKNDASPVSFPMLNPYGHVAFQAQRGDVHTVLVDGTVVKRGPPARRGRPGRRTPPDRGDRRPPALDPGRGRLGSRA